VLLGHGDGTFAPATEIPTGDSPVVVAIGDVNRDGALDLAVAYSPFSTNPTKLSLLLGAGNGTFGPRTDIDTGTGPASVALADLNQDSRLDLVTANPNYQTVSVMLGHGDGTFGSRVDFTTGNHPVMLALADLDRDGKLDLVTANQSGNTVTVLSGNGNGTFGSRADFGTGSTPVFVAIADLNGDGRLDIVTANSRASTVTVLLNQSSLVAVEPAAVPGRVALSQSYPNPAWREVSIAFALPEANNVSLSVYDLSGRLVRSLYQGYAPAGAHVKRWDRRTSTGTIASPGVYFYALRTNGTQLTRRLVLVQ
jgi:hypothetical protein